MSYKILSVAALGALILGTAHAATPTLELSIQATGTKSGSSGLLIDSTHTGALNYSAALGDFNLVVSTGTGIGSANTSAGQGILLNNISITGSSSCISTSSLQIVLTEDNLTGAGSLQTIAEGLSATILAGSTTGTTISVSDYIAVGGTNATFLNQITGAYIAGSGTQVGSTLTLTPTSLGVAASASANPTFNTGGTVFAEAIVLTIHTSAGTNVGTTASLSPQPVKTAVPEPATMLIFGAGLAALGFARRRKIAATV